MEVVPNLTAEQLDTVIKRLGGEEKLSFFRNEPTVYGAIVRGVLELWRNSQRMETPLNQS